MTTKWSGFLIKIRSSPMILTRDRYLWLISWQVFFKIKKGRLNHSWRLKVQQEQSYIYIISYTYLKYKISNQCQSYVYIYINDFMLRFTTGRYFWRFCTCYKISKVAL